MNNQFNNIDKRIVISLGDPAGIGMEVTLKALASSELPKAIEPILVGCKGSIRRVYESFRG